MINRNLSRLTGRELNLRWGHLLHPASSSMGRITLTFNSQGVDHIAHLASDVFLGKKNVEQVPLSDFSIHADDHLMRSRSGYQGAERAAVDVRLRLTNPVIQVMEVRFDGSQVDSAFLEGRTPHNIAMLFRLLNNYQLGLVRTNDIYFSRESSRGNLFYTMRFEPSSLSLEFEHAKSYQKFLSSNFKDGFMEFIRTATDILNALSYTYGIPPISERNRQIQIKNITVPDTPL